MHVAHVTKKSWASLTSQVPLYHFFLLVLCPLPHNFYPSTRVYLRAYIFTAKRSAGHSSWKASFTTRTPLRLKRRL